MQQIGICGLGLIGKQRLDALLGLGWRPSQIIAFDPKISIGNFGKFEIAHSIDFMLANDVDSVIIATPHDIAPDLTRKFLDNGVRVLMEKPMGRNLKEAIDLHSHENAKNLSVGFNYRFMPSIQHAKSILDKGDLGKIHSVKMDLGHGGAPKDRNSWKLSPQAAGGGVVLDPGIHLLDLIGYLFDLQATEIEFTGANSWKGFWDTGIEESVNAIGNFYGSLLNLSVSIVAWRTRFEIEIIGTEGYLKLSGRGRTDGPQMITIGKRWGWANAKSQSDSEIVMKMAQTDESLALELAAWLNHDPRMASSQDGLNAELLRTNILDKLKL
jgi:1,5-anhydro-D-fructose reductase (1,5-anhydro-D-mannitol-forming)